MDAPARRGVWVLLLGACVWLTFGCSSGISPPRPSTVASCGPYPDQATSPYVLPYPVGDTHIVFQGNCDNISHFASTEYKYAYDFRMEIGDPVVAAAAGRVVKVVQRFPNTTLDPALENYVVISLGGGLLSHYSHLDQDGVFVEVGDDVRQGQLIARSGASGSPIAHLHFQVYLASGMTVAVTFLNTRPHPNGLVRGQSYTAEPY
jgi:murein DD-endopeptidase MepM/ murein hydrolase activator NlpD